MLKAKKELRDILEKLQKTHSGSGCEPDLWRGVLEAMNAQIGLAITKDLQNRISSLSIPELLMLRELTNQVLESGVLPTLDDSKPDDSKPDDVKPDDVVPIDPVVVSHATRALDPYHVEVTRKEGVPLVEKKPGRKKKEAK